MPYSHPIDANTCLTENPAQAFFSLDNQTSNCVRGLGQWRLSIKSNRTLSNTLASHRLHLQRNQRYVNLLKANPTPTPAPCQLPTIELQSSYDINQIHQSSSTLQLVKQRHRSTVESKHQTSYHHLSTTVANLKNGSFTNQK